MGRTKYNVFIPIYIIPFYITCNTFLYYPLLLFTKLEKEKPKGEEEKNNQQKPSKISKQDAEEKLKALQQKEKILQDKLKKINVASPKSPEKDW